MPQKLITSPVNLCYRGFPWLGKNRGLGLNSSPLHPHSPALSSSFFFFLTLYPTPPPFTTSQHWNEFGSMGLIKITPTVIFMWIPLYSAEIKKSQLQIGINFENFPVGGDQLVKYHHYRHQRPALYVATCWVQCDTEGFYFIDVQSTHCGYVRECVFVFYILPTLRSSALLRCRLYNPGKSTHSILFIIHRAMLSSIRPAGLSCTGVTAVAVSLNLSRSVKMEQQSANKWNEGTKPIWIWMCPQCDFQMAALSRSLVT